MKAIELRYAMNEVSIDRLVLQAPGLSEAEGRKLGVLVARGLGALGAIGGGREIPELRLDLQAAPTEGVDKLARHIVAEVARQIARIN
jgi:hypothetical protein